MADKALKNVKALSLQKKGARISQQNPKGQNMAKNHNLATVSPQNININLMLNIDKKQGRVLDELKNEGHHEP